MNDRAILDRQPDYVLGLWEFFFLEMLQYHSSEGKYYPIKLNKKCDEIIWLSDKDNHWYSYLDDAEKVYSAYVDFNIEKVLLG